MCKFRHRFGVMVWFKGGLRGREMSIVIIIVVIAKIKNMYTLNAFYSIINLNVIT